MWALFVAEPGLSIRSAGPERNSLQRRIARTLWTQIALHEGDAIHVQCLPPPSNLRRSGYPAHNIPN